MALVTTVGLCGLASDTAACGEFIPLGLRLEVGAAHSGRGISDTTELLGGALNYRLSEHLGWRLRGGVLEFGEANARVGLRFLQLNLTYYFPDSERFMMGPYLTAGYGLYKPRSQGTLVSSNDDSAVSGVNVGVGYQYPIVKDQWLSTTVELSYNATSQVNPANFVSLNVGIQLGF